jgi:hypothetical protein
VRDEATRIVRRPSASSPAELERARVAEHVATVRKDRRKALAEQLEQRSGGRRG